MSTHWDGCWEFHPACCVAEVRRLKSELARRTTKTFTGYRPPVYLGAPQAHTGSPLHPPAYTTSATVIPCGTEFYTHHGDEPPSATP